MFLSHYFQVHVYIYIYIYTIHMYSGITSGRVLNGELLYTKILEVNLFAFATDCFVEISPHSTGHIAICPVEWGEISTKQSVANENKLTSRIFVYIYIYIYIYIYETMRTCWAISQ